VAIKQYSGEKVSNAIYEIINNSRIVEQHPNVVALRAVQFDVESNNDNISQIRLLFDLVKGESLRDFVQDKTGRLKNFSFKQRKLAILSIFKQIIEGV
jgi:hypothetical protein